MSGMACNGFAEYLSLNEFNYLRSTENGSKLQYEINVKNKSKNKLEIIKESNLFEGTPIIYNDIEGYEIIDFKSGFNQEYVNLVLSYDYDFVCWKKCESFDDTYYYRKLINKNKFSHNYKIKNM